MSQALAYRGPDDSGEWFDPASAVGLCHRRLSIIDVSPLGHQPMWDASGRLAIVFNGEIYNYPELRKQLLDQGYLFASQTDTEVLLNLYLRDGEAMLSRLNGMFAFAIWDRDRSSLFIARDALGVKPLYYTQTSRGFLFASALHALLVRSWRLQGAESDGGARLPYAAVCAGAVHDAARCVEARAGTRPDGAVGIASSGRGNGASCRSTTAKFSGSSAQAAASLRDHMEAATERQMIADVPVGAFLSGGLDSSSVVALASRHAKDGQLDCFTIAFRDRAWNDEGMADDLPYAQSFAQHLGVRLHVVEAGAEILDDLSEMIYHLDEPQADPAALHVRAICRHARDMGVKVLLSGTGGDDLFAGYRRHNALMSERYWSWLPIGVRSMLASIGRGMDVATPGKRRLAKAFRNADRTAERTHRHLLRLDRSAVAQPPAEQRTASAADGSDRPDSTPRFRQSPAAGPFGSRSDAVPGAEAFSCRPQSQLHRQDEHGGGR